MSLASLADGIGRLNESADTSTRKVTSQIQGSEGNRNNVDNWASVVTPNPSVSRTDIISSDSGAGSKEGNVGKPSSFVTAMISGVAAAVVCCVLILLYVIYRYRKNDLFASGGKPQSSKPSSDNHRSDKKDKKSSSSPPAENGNCGGLTVGGVIGGPGSPGIMTGDIRIGSGNGNNGVTKQHPNAKINGIIGMHQNRTLSKEKEYFV